MLSFASMRRVLPTTTNKQHLKNQIGGSKEVHVRHSSRTKELSTADKTVIHGYTKASCVNSFLQNAYRGNNVLRLKEQTRNREDVVGVGAAIYVAHTDAVARRLTNTVFKTRTEMPFAVFSGVSETPLRAWRASNTPITEPVDIIIPSFMSTTTWLDKAAQYSGPECSVYTADEWAMLKSRTKIKEQTDTVRNIFRIFVPGGSQAVSVLDNSAFPDDEEVILQRGTVLRVYPNPRSGPSTWYGGAVIVWDAEVVEQRAEPISNKSFNTQITRAKRTIANLGTGALDFFNGASSISTRVTRVQYQPVKKLKAEIPFSILLGNTFEEFCKMTSGFEKPLPKDILSAPFINPSADARAFVQAQAEQIKSVNTEWHRQVWCSYSSPAYINSTYPEVPCVADYERRAKAFFNSIYGTSL